MKMKFIALILFIASAFCFATPGKAQVDLPLAPEQLKIARSRLYLSGDEANQFDLLLSNKNRTPDEEAKFQALVETGIALFDEGNSLAMKPFRTPQEEEQLEQLKAVLKSNESALIRVISFLYSPEPFNPMAATLPESYEGVNFDILWLSLQSKLGSKQEFETTAAYAERIKKAESTPLFGQFSIQSTLATMLDPEHTSTQYDADKQVMQVAFSLYSLSDGDQTQSLMVSKTIKPLGSYTGTNAYGAQVDVLKWQEQHRFLFHENNKQFKFKFDNILPKITVNIPMTVSAAMEAKPDIRVLAVYRVKKPYIGFKSQYVTPTVRYPSEKQIDKSYLIVDLLGLWFYNIRTGVVYQKLVPQKR